MNRIQKWGYQIHPVDLRIKWSLNGICIVMNIWSNIVHRLWPPKLNDCQFGLIDLNICPWMRFLFSVFLHLAGLYAACLMCLMWMNYITDKWNTNKIQLRKVKKRRRDCVGERWYAPNKGIDWLPLRCSSEGERTNCLLVCICNRRWACVYWNVIIILSQWSSFLRSHFDVWCVWNICSAT